MKNSNGIDFFPFSVDFFEDDKIALTEAEFGIKGSYLAVRFLCKIYKFEGYFYQWGRDQCLLFAKSLGEGFSSKLVEEVVQGLIRRGFFDKAVYDSFKVLTSRGMQYRYFEACKRRQIVNINKELLLADPSQYPNVKVFDPKAKPPVADPVLPERKQAERQAEAPETPIDAAKDSGRPRARRSRAQIDEDERWQIIAYFMTERNFYAPVKQFEYFRNWNNTGSRSWDAMKHGQRVSAATMWKQQDSNGKPDTRTKFKETAFLPVWSEVYEIVRDNRPDLLPSCLNDSVAFLPNLVMDMYGANREEYHGLRCPKALADYINAEWKTKFAEVFRPVLGGLRLRFGYTDKQNNEKK